MKLKRLPEDFQVEERSDFEAAAGPFAFYRLTKRGLGTFEAVAAIEERWRIDRARISYGGLKDRHALTQQFLTIEGGPRRGLKQTGLELEYLGQAARPYTAADIAANQFRIVSRQLTREQADAALVAVEEVRRDGLANYFDRQRFGSLGASGEFIAQPWCAGQYERAIWLAVAEPNLRDRPRDRVEKEFLREHWGDWQACRAAVAEPERRRVVEHLARRERDFRGAIARLDRDLRGMYLAAFQSFLWNQVLAELLRERCTPEQLIDVDVAGERLPQPRGLDTQTRDELAALELPLPSARQHLAEGPLATLYARVLGRHGLEMRMLRVKYPRDTFFSKGARAPLVQPGELTCAAAGDDLYPGTRKLTLEFRLPRGAYGTVLLARVASSGASGRSVDSPVRADLQ